MNLKIIIEKRKELKKQLKKREKINWKYSKKKN